MSKCWHCGEEIEFRYVDGRLVPIHLNDGWCQGGHSNNLGSLRGKNINQNNSFNDFCRKTTCPKCKKEVFFIRHNGGSVWVNSLDWPWTKHPCMDTLEEPSWYRYFKKVQPQSGDEKLFNGVVVEAIWKSGEPSQIILAIDGGDQGRIILATEGTSTADYLQGKVIIVNFKKNIIIVSTHDVKPIYESGIDPEKIGLPSDWLQ